MPQRHHIQSQQYEITVDSVGQGRRLQSEISAQLNSQVMSALHRVFDRCSAPEEWLIVDRLTIDLGEIGEEDLMRNAPNLIEKSLEDQLISAKNKADRGLSNVSLRKGEQTTIKVRSQEHKQLDAFLQFLKTGSLPPWASGEDLADVFALFVREMEELQEQDIRGPSAGGALSRMDLPFLGSVLSARELQQVFAHPHVIQRLLYQMPTDLVVKIYRRLHPQHSEFVVDLLIWLKELQDRRPFLSGKSSFPGMVKEIFVATHTGRLSLLGTTSGKNHYVRQLLAAIFQSDRTHIGFEQFLRTWVEAVWAYPKPPAQTHREFRQWHKSLLEEIEHDEVWERVLKTEQPKEEARQRREQNASKKSESDDSRADESFSAEDDKDLTTKKLKTTDPEDQWKHRPGEANESSDELKPSLPIEPISDENQEDQLLAPRRSEEPKEQGRRVPWKPDFAQNSQPKEGDSFFVENAGIVLLWPYLPTFFDAVELIAEGAFVSIEKQVRAALVLQRLVFDDQAAFPEYEMILNKVLCGLPIDEPLPMEIDLTAQEKEESDHLLNFVVKQWTALKSTNADSLRSTFLRREGLLKRAHQGWTVQVERNTFDILLDRLPWGYSLIKLPWLDEMIHVEW